MFGAKKAAKEKEAKPKLQEVKSESTNGHAASKGAAMQTPVKTKFEFFAPEANKVTLAGTFNEWDMQRTALEKDARGMWSLTLNLAPGRYLYRYVVDGMWMNEQRPSSTESNPYGSVNNVLVVAG